MSRSDYGSSLKDSKSCDPPIYLTAKITTDMVPNPSIVVTVYPSFCNNISAKFINC